MKVKTWAIALWICAIAVLPARCQDPWKVEYASSHKLEFFDSAADFDTAKALCDGRSAKMIRMDNEHVRNKVYATIRSATTVTYFWIGATGTMEQWRWLGETTDANTSFIRWYKNQPDNSGGEEHCLTVRKNDGKYGDIKKSFNVAGTICQKIRDPWVTEVASNYKLEFFDFALTFDEAKELCTARSGIMIQIDDDQVKNKVYETITSATTAGYFWIGATRESGQWKWLGRNTAVDMNSITWADGQPDKDGIKDYLAVGKAAKYKDVEKDFDNVGTICQIDAYCRTNPNTCHNGASCSSMLTSPLFTCQCTPGYFGETCRTKFCSTHPNPCHNAGTCVSELTSPFYTCQCRSGYFGETCGQRYCTAHPHTCQNGGICSSTLRSSFYTCRCIGGYFGQTCGKRYCGAHTNPCQNGACSSTSTSPYYSCRCAAGYYGNTCGNQYCAAYPKTCKNGGTCSSLTISPYFTCQCADGYHGKTCSGVILSDHGKPLIQNVSPKECSANGTVEILWKPYNQTAGVAHRVTVQSLNATFPHNLTQTTVKNNVVFGNLLPSTKYQLQITVCPDHCISKLTTTAEFTTGVGLPGVPSPFNPILKGNSDSSVCIVTWNWPAAITADQISHIEVTWKSSTLLVSNNNLASGKEIVSTMNVTSTVQQSAISTLPNRNYSVMLRTFTCAGPGPSVTASGKCQTKPEAPTSVKNSEVSDSNAGIGLRVISVALPDESNGHISCVFVLMTEGVSSSTEVISRETLKKGSFSSQSRRPDAGESYIALAIPRPSFDDSTYNALFGDNSTSYCDPVTSYDLIQPRAIEEKLKGTGLRGKNWPLHEGATYSYFTVTTTPSSSGRVKYGRSEAASFVGNSPVEGPNTLTIALVIMAAVFLASTMACGAWILYSRRKRNIGTTNTQTSRPVPTPSDDCGLYEPTGYENTALGEVKENVEGPYEEIRDSAATNEASSHYETPTAIQNTAYETVTV